MPDTALSLLLTTLERVGVALERGTDIVVVPIGQRDGAGGAGDNEAPSPDGRGQLHVYAYGGEKVAGRRP